MNQVNLLVEDIPEKLCLKCGESWPETTEFFYRTCRGGGLHSPCKACQAEQRQVSSAVTPCCVPGCTNPRHQRKSGIYDSRCYAHRYSQMKKCQGEP